MNVLMLITRQGADETFSPSLDRYREALEGEGHALKTMDIDSLDIRYCTGCWTCWWQTPGRCRFSDGMEDVYRSSLESDLVILASPLVLGFPSASMKKVQDRLIPLIHPYIELVEGECHHRKRYDRYPELGLFLGLEQDTDAEDLEIVEDIYRRFALNMRASLRGLVHSGMSTREAVDATT